jgi:hypothetical protein
MSRLISVCLVLALILPSQADEKPPSPEAVWSPREAPHPPGSTGRPAVASACS